MIALSSYGELGRNTTLRQKNPRAGFLTAWMYVFYSPLCAGPIYAYFGFLLQQELKAQYGINAPYLWWLCVIVGAPAVASRPGAL